MFENAQPQMQPQQPPQMPQLGNSPSGQRGSIQLGQAPSSPLPDEQTSEKVYTMPQKFMPQKMPSGGGGGSKKKKIFIIIGIIVAFLIIVAAIVVFAFTITQTDEEPININADALNPSANTAEINQNANQNDNENENINENENVNGSTLNFNVNDDLNENINGDLFPNTNTNKNSNSNTNTALTTAPYRKVTDTRDKDQDGLTDEEESIYNTKFNLPDTDQDNYVDGQELKNLFSPIKKGQTLIESGLVAEYNNSKMGWSMYYPSDWVADPLDDTKREVLFTADSVDGELVEVIVSDNSEQMTAAAWYASLYSDIEEKDLDPITAGGLQGVTSLDGFTWFLADENYLISINYNFGTKTQINFRATFEMMLTSFEYTAPEPSISDEDEEESEDANVNTNSNANSNVNSNTNSSNINVSAANTNSSSLNNNQTPIISEDDKTNNSDF